MYKYCFLLLLLCQNVLCDCVVFNFEGNSLDDFTNNSQICRDLPMWDLGRYDDLKMDSPHENSTFYISPKSELSCVTSLSFPITAGGTLDVKFYLELNTHLDIVAIVVYRSMPNEFDTVVATVVLSTADFTLTRGWQTVRLTPFGFGVYNGYVAFMGVASKSSVILIDSVRFIAPSLSEELCPIYIQKEEDDTNATTISTIGPETASTITPEIPSTFVPETTSNIVPETPSDKYPTEISTSSPKTTTDITSTTSPKTTTVATSTSRPDTTTETSTKTTLDTTTENFPHTTSTSSPDSNTETTSETSLQTTTENDPETCSTTTQCNLDKTNVRVNVNINIKKYFIP